MYFCVRKVEVEGITVTSDWCYSIRRPAFALTPLERTAETIDGVDGAIRPFPLAIEHYTAVWREVDGSTDTIRICSAWCTRLKCWTAASTARAASCPTRKEICHASPSAGVRIVWNSCRDILCVRWSLCAWYTLSVCCSRAGLTILPHSTGRCITSQA